MSAVQSPTVNDSRNDRMDGNNDDNDVPDDSECLLGTFCATTTTAGVCVTSPPRIGQTARSAPSIIHHPSHFVLP